MDRVYLIEKYLVPISDEFNKKGTDLICMWIWQKHTAVCRRETRLRVIFLSLTSPLANAIWRLEAYKLTLYFHNGSAQYSVVCYVMQHDDYALREYMLCYSADGNAKWKKTINILMVWYEME